MLCGWGSVVGGIGRCVVWGMKDLGRCVGEGGSV